MTNVYQTVKITRRVVTTDIYATVTTWHQALYPCVEKIGVKCALQGGYSLLHVVVCCTLPGSQLLFMGPKYHRV